MSGYDEADAVNSSPAHYETHETYRVETTLYSVRDERLGRVVLSDTVNPHSVVEVIESVSEHVAARMKAEGLIGP
jgi:predicted hydrolase (HD superfamily)